MARILIGNIKGPKGDTGLQGIQGEIGPAGPQGPLPPLVNNALATEAGVAALDSAMGPTFQNQIDTLTSNLGGVKIYNAYTGASATKVRVLYGSSHFCCFVYGEQNGTPVAFIVTNGNSVNLTTNGSIYMNAESKYFILNLANYSTAIIISNDNLTVTTQA